MAMLDDLVSGRGFRPTENQGRARKRYRASTEARLLGLKRFLEANYDQPVCNQPHFRS